MTPYRYSHLLGMVEVKGGGKCTIPWDIYYRAEDVQKRIDQLLFINKELLALLNDGLTKMHKEAKRAEFLIGESAKGKETRYTDDTQMMSWD